MSILRFVLAGACAVSMSASASAQTVAQADSAARAATRTNGLPLIPTRTLRFTTDEGTWISLDVSPDSKTIIFELLGDLYTLPLAGGAATRITSGQGYDTQPRYSPDGSKIVFVSDRNGSENIWTANADGTQPKILSRSERVNFVSPTWTPDGQYVVVTRAGQLWLYHRDGGSGVQMTGVRPPGAPATAPPLPTLLGAAFGNDARYVWVTASGNLGGDFQGGLGIHANEPQYGPDHGVRSSGRRIGTYQIAQYDRTLGRAAVRTSESEGAFRPMPSPDGRWLVYATRYDSRQGLKVLDLESGSERWLLMGVQRDASQGGADRDIYPNSAYTPDSRALITAYNGKIWRVAIPTGEATPIPFTAEVDQQLAPLARFDYPINDTTLVVSQIRGTQPSPDGRRVVFSALDRLWIADLPEGRGGPGRVSGAAATHQTITNARRLTSADLVEHAPVWSPDGRFVAYVTWDDSAGGAIWRVPVDGGAPQRLTSRAAFYDKISYSPNGQRIVGVRGSLNSRLRTLEDFGSHGATAELEIIWLPASGGNGERIAWLGSGATQQGRNVPHFGPDSTRIYVWTGGTEGLVSMRFDGTDRRSIVRVTGLPSPPGPAGPGAPSTPDEVLISPDGSRAVVRSNGNVFLITIPPIGGVAPTVGVTGSVVPTTRLTKVGGDFVGWSADGRTAFYSIGRSFLRWDVAMADSLVRDSVSRAEQAAATSSPTPPAPARPDSAARRDSTARPDSAARRGSAYEPVRVDFAITARKDRPSGAVVLRGARIITMKGDEVISSGDIVVRDNRIVAIGRRGNVRVPAGARVIDVSGKTIMPGLVDVHAHTWVAWGVHRPQVSQFLAQLAYGVTTQRDPQTSSEDVVTYSDLVETGAIIGPRVYSTGPGIFGADNIRSLEEARDVVRRYADHFNTQTIKQYVAGDRKVRQWVITAARERGLTTTTEGASDFVMNLTLMQDGYAGLEHSLPISPLYKDIAQLHAFSGLTYTPTFIVAYGGPSGFGKYLTSVDLDGDQKLRRFTPHDEIDKWKSVQWQREDQYVHKLHAQQLPKLLAAGGRLGLGSHGELQGLGTHWELWMMASGGMKAHDALRFATITGAESIGLSKDVGSLEVGKLADLIVLDRNPLTNLENTTSLRYVMKNGRLYAAATLDEVWPRERKLPTQWWWKLEPPGGGGGSN
jgi:imidazolonepropionase-like amidohydrolase/Tol biopolymer transport system component